MNYAFIHSSLYDSVEYKKTKKNMTVLVCGEKISDIFPDGKNRIPKDYKIINLSGKYLMPGLIDLHAHLFGTGKPSSVLGGGSLQKMIVSYANSKSGKKLTDRLVQRHAENSLASGVTTIRSMGDFNFSDVRIRNLINSGKITGPRLLVPGPAITCKGGHGDGTFARSSNDPAELEYYVSGHFAQGVDLIKICATGGVTDAAVKGEPGVLKMTPEQMKAVCDRAHMLGYKVASHTESTKGIEEALKAGVDSIEHGSTLTDEAVKLFSEKGATLTVTFSPALPLAHLSPSVTKLSETAYYNSKVLLKQMIDGAKRALTEGITVGMGTDSSCPLVTSYNMYREVKYFAKYLGASNGFALHTATAINARIAGVDSVTGTIEVGKDADILILDGNPLKDLDNLSKVHMVMARGKLLENPKIKKIDKVDMLLDSIDK